VAGDVTQDAERRLRAEGLDPTAWSNSPGDRYPAHDHGYDKVIVVARGSIRFGLPADGRAVDLAEGDRLELPAGTRHDAVAGPTGVTCLEAHLPSGSLPRLAHRSAGAWQDETDGHTHA
jgi:quercetin dioxygenase-like cupin family protein